MKPAKKNRGAIDQVGSFMLADGRSLTAAQVAEAIGLTAKAVSSAFYSLQQSKQYRVEVQCKGRGHKMRLRVVAFTPLDVVPSPEKLARNKLAQARALLGLQYQLVFQQPMPGCLFDRVTSGSLER